MPIYRGQRLTDLISRLAYRAIPLVANIYQAWPHLATGLTVTPGAAQAYGSWVEFISAAAAPAVPFTISHISTNNQTIRGGSFQIGTGAAGAEVPVSTAIAFGYNPGLSMTIPAVLAIIPGGTRVALRMRAGLVDNCFTRIVSCKLPSRLDAFNTLRLSAKQTSFYPGDVAKVWANSAVSASATPWTYGSYAQWWAAGDETSPTIITKFGHMYNGAADAQVAWATGAAASEVVFAEFPVFMAGLTNSMWTAQLPFPILIPGSTRIAVKAAAAGAFDLDDAMPEFIKAAYMP